MISKETRKLVTLGNHGIILNPKSKKEKNILFADISKIHICIDKHQLALKFFLIIYFIFTLFCLKYLNLQLCIVSIFIFIINVKVMYSLDLKSYKLQIILKNNLVIESRIPKKLKNDFIHIIHQVRTKL